MNENLLANLPNDGLDYFTDYEIGQGNAQLILSLPLFLMLFSEGCESAVLGILLPELQHQWDINDSDKSNLITLVFTGVVIGSALNSIADKIGRYKVIYWASITLSIFGILSSLCVTFNQFLLVRFCYGIGMGVSLPMAGTYISEISTTEYRSTTVSFFNVLWVIGATLSSIVGWILLKGFHWRILFFLIALPSLAAFYIHVKFGKQSLRYLISRGKHEQALQYVKFAKQKNGHPDPPITLQKIKEITVQEKYELPVSQLITPKYKLISITLCILWVTMAFIYYALTLLLPSILDPILESEDEKYFIICCVSFIQIGAYGVAIRLMENQNLGRKNSLIIAISIVSIMSLFSGMIHSTFLFTIVFGTMKLFTEVLGMIVFTYTSECYPTAFRAKAMSALSMTGRISTVILGIVGISAMKWLDGNGLYCIFFGLTIISICLVWKADKQTLGEGIDG